MQWKQELQQQYSDTCNIETCISAPFHLWTIQRTQMVWILSAMYLTYSEYKYHPVNGVVTKASVNTDKRYFPTISTQIILHQYKTDLFHVQLPANYCVKSILHNKPGACLMIMYIKYLITICNDWIIFLHNAHFFTIQSWTTVLLPNKLHHAWTQKKNPTDIFSQKLVCEKIQLNRPGTCLFFY